MANKTVENPCIGTGEPTSGEPQIIKGKTYAMCPVCNKMVSINKAARTARKHNGVYQPTLWEGLGMNEEEFFNETPDQRKDTVGAGSV